jgi:hypothetical protein
LTGGGAGFVLDARIFASSATVAGPVHAGTSAKQQWSNSAPYNVPSAKTDSNTTAYVLNLVFMLITPVLKQFPRIVTGFAD